MEALLSPRLKDLTLAALALLLAVAAAWAALAPAGQLSPAQVQARIARDGERMENALAVVVRACLQRSERLGRAFAAGRLDASDLEKREALVRVENGIISGYVGEIFFFKPLALSEGGWGLIRKNQDVYFLRRVAPRTYYLRFFMDLRSSPLHEAAAYAYPVFDLKFSNRPLPAGPGDFSYDQAQGRFYYTRVLKASQDQLILSLVFSGSTLSQRALRARRALAFVLAFLFFLGIFLAGSGRGALRTIVRQLSLAAMAFTAWWGIAWLAPRNIYFPACPGGVRSVFQLLALFVLLFLGARLLLKKMQLRSDLLALAVFNGAALAAFLAADAVLRRVDFPFGDFALDGEYLGLLALVVFWFAAPLLAAASFLGPGPGRKAWPLVLLQAALLALFSLLVPLPVTGPLLLALALAVLLLRPPWPGVRAGVPLLLLALAASSWLGQYALRERRVFVSENLKPIFASQDDYAKLVAREIVYELNSRNTPFFAFFDSPPADELADGWKNTLAARENIASGIHVVAADGRVLRSFSYQIPYIPLDKRDFFPFWHVENVEADLFGKQVRLAVATINVFQKERYLGYIMVQVLNTADLILKSREAQSVLTVNRRIPGAGIGYIKLDGNRRILENPANINLDDLGALSGDAGAWVRFRSMGQAFSGHVFRIGDGTALIFYPEDTFFKAFSEFVKVLGFVLLLAALFSLRRLRRFQWRPFFGSFSMKVFASLLLLSIITATVFSLFSLNFYASSQETRRGQAAYRRGRSALNIIQNLLAGGGEITQAHMFLLEKILENDISVYENGILLYTSDHRKIIRSQLPVHLNSRIRDKLQREGSPFELRQDGSALELFFKTAGDYVFQIEFPFDSADGLRARRYYADFMVTIFFVLIVTGLAAAFFFRNRIVAPIHRLNRGMAAVQRGDLEPLAAIPSESELRELYLGFNSMLQGIQAQQQNASEIARMKTLVQLGRRVAHEVKNPLTPIRLSAEQILRSLQDPGEGGREVIASAVRYIIEETEHLRRVAFGFLNLSKLDELKAEPFCLDDLVAEAVAHLRAIYPQVRFSVTAAGAGAIDVVADRQKIKQVIDNVLTNALEALGAGAGEIDVALDQEPGLAVVRIRDNGEGIAAEELERIAREEFSSKDLGTGLGLVIARRFLELHRGSLEIESRPGLGTTVVLRFAKNAPAA
ncbi:MAG: HAMP domain-containing histidine kinase [Acidobacteria bacterium]|jgi:signal transduction histidine kinase|nr:HAMP domain-containing histidine kinase [Acidobacteriota bacterium]